MKYPLKHLTKGQAQMIILRDPNFPAEFGRSKMKAKRAWDNFLQTYWRGWEALSPERIKKLRRQMEQDMQFGDPATKKIAADSLKILKILEGYLQ